MSLPNDSVSLRIGVTAHKDLSAADPAVLAHQVRDIVSLLQTQFPQLPLVIMTPLAEGGDTLVAHVALDMGIPIEIPLPMPVELYEQDFSTAAALAEFRRLCQLGNVYEAPRTLVDSDCDVALDAGNRDRLYAELGLYISAHCHILLALWDGDPSEQLGGTHSVLQYHLSGEMPQLLPAEAQSPLFAGKEDGLVFHIPCPRPGSGDKNRYHGWLTHSGRYPAAVLPYYFDSAFKHMEAFNRDVQRFHRKIESVGDSLLRGEEMGRDPFLSAISHRYKQADWLANYFSRRVGSGLAVIHVLAMLMGFSFILYSEYERLSFLLPCFLVIFFIAWSFHRLAETRQWHRKYLDYRALAEGLRVQFYWALIGIGPAEGAAVVYDKLMEKQVVELVWIRHVMRGVGPACQHLAYQPFQSLEQAVQCWIGDKQSGAGQLGYFQRASVSRAKLLKRNALTGKMILWSGIAVAGLLLLVGDSLTDNSVTGLLVLMGMLPLIAGIREAYSYKKADRELTKQYQSMLKTFSRADQCIAETDDHDFKERVLLALGEACLEEHSEWLLTHRERPLAPAGLHT
ncbi:MAG: hypothetical protein V7746_15995 [Halioglobus sp.]